MSKSSKRSCSWGSNSRGKSVGDGQNWFGVIIIWPDLAEKTVPLSHLFNQQRTKNKDNSVLLCLINHLGSGVWSASEWSTNSTHSFRWISMEPQTANQISPFKTKYRNHIFVWLHYGHLILTLWYRNINIILFLWSHYGHILLTLWYHFGSHLNSILRSAVLLYKVIHYYTTKVTVQQSKRQNPLPCAPSFFFFVVVRVGV